MYPLDMREMAFRIIRDLIYKSPVLFNQIQSHVNFVCKEEYEECILDISKYIIGRDHYILWPAEKSKHSDFIMDIQEQVYLEALARNNITISTINNRDKGGRNGLSHAAQEGDILRILAIIHFSSTAANNYDEIGRSPLSYAAQHSD
jgi:hypothetical protein